MTARDTIRAEFGELLNAFVRSGDEADLLAAADFGWRMIASDVGPEELVAAHTEAMRQLVGHLAPVAMPDAIARGNQLLLEATMAYGLAYRDLLERERQQRSQAEGIEAQMRRILESISDGFFALDTQDRFTYVNHRAEQLVGLSRVAMLGRCFWDVFPHVRELQGAFTEATETQHTISLDWQAPGHGSWYGARMFPTPQGTSVYFRDITAERQMELERQHLVDSLARERSLLLAVMGSMQDGLVVIGAGGEVQYVNPQVGHWFHVDPATLVGRSIAAVFEDLTACLIEPDTVWTQFQQALDSVDQAPRFDVTLTEATVHDVSVQVFPVVTPGLQQASGVLLHDITHEREVARTREELVSVVSHELRTPLSAVVGFAELLQDRDYSDAERREFLGIMVQEGRRLTALLNDFLDVQRLEAGRQRLTIRPTEVRGMLERAVAAAGEDTSRPILVLLPDDLPRVQADGDRIHQVLLNLLSNARKYSPQGGTITVSTGMMPAGVRVAVQDQGLGLPPEALPRLFEKFYRVDNADRRQITGTGLGLAIVKNIIEAHGGRVGANSTGPGQGSTFWFSLPVAERDTEAS